MSEIIDRDVKTKREVWDRNKAITHFNKIGEKYKAEIIKSIPKNENFPFTIMVILGMIYVVGLICLRQEKLEKHLN